MNAGMNQRCLPNCSVFPIHRSSDACQECGLFVHNFQNVIGKITVQAAHSQARFPGDRLFVACQCIANAAG
jgi:hypothetical protein